MDFLVNGSNTHFMNVAIRLFILKLLKRIQIQRLRFGSKANEVIVSIKVKDSLVVLFQLDRQS